MESIVVLGPNEAKQPAGRREMGEILLFPIYFPDFSWPCCPAGRPAVLGAHVWPASLDNINFQWPARLRNILMRANDPPRAPAERLLWAPHNSTDCRPSSGCGREGRANKCATSDKRTVIAAL